MKKRGPTFAYYFFLCINIRPQFDQLFDFFYLSFSGGNDQLIVDITLWNTSANSS